VVGLGSPADGRVTFGARILNNSFFGAAYFSATDWDGLSFTNITFSKLGTNAHSAPYVLFTNTGSKIEGPKFHTCSFRTTTNSVEAIGVLSAGAGAETVNVVLDKVYFESGGANVVVRLEDVGPFSITGCQLEADAFGFAEAWFDVSYPNWGGGDVQAIFERNRSEKSIGGPQGAFFVWDGSPSSDSSVRFKNNSLHTSSVNAARATGLISFENAPGLKLEVEGNQVIIPTTNPGSTAPIFYTRSSVNLRLIGNRFTSNANNAPINIDDSIFTITGNFLSGNSTATSLFTAGPSAIERVFSDNYLNLFQLSAGAGGQLSFPENIRVVNNQFKVTDPSLFSPGSSFIVSANSTVIGNSFDTTGFAIAPGILTVFSGDKVVITGNRFTGAATRAATGIISTASCDDLVVSNNQFLNVRSLASMVNPQRSTFSGNSALGVRAGIILGTNANYCTISNNVLDFDLQTTDEDQNTVGIECGTGCTVSGNSVLDNNPTANSGNTRAVVRVANNGTVIGNTLSQMESSGIGIVSGTGCMISGNNVFSVGSSYNITRVIGIDAGIGCTVTGNKILTLGTSSFAHISIRASSDCVVTNNVIQQSIGNGPRMINITGSNGVVQGNNITFSGYSGANTIRAIDWDIGFFNIVIAGNVLIGSTANNPIAIDVNGSDDGVVTDNIIKLPGATGTVVGIDLNGMTNVTYGGNSIQTTGTHIVAPTSGDPTGGNRLY
jgi:hypothetical protein